MKIDYKLVDLEREKYTEGLESFLELTDTHLHWRARYYADVPVNPEDPTQGWHNKLKSYDSWVKRATVMGVGMSYLFDSNVWQVFIDANGLGGCIEMYFKRESEAVAFAEIITKWILEI